jgi:hypothetical protein
LSASLAGLAGLVASLRRGSDLRPLDAFRLREIVEFAFANILLAVGLIPLSQLLEGGTSAAVRIAAVLAIAYVLGSSVVLICRTRANSISTTRGWVLAALVVDLAMIGSGLWAIVSGSIAVYEATLVALLARPMLAFMLVLASFEAPQSPSP